MNSRIKKLFFIICLFVGDLGSFAQDGPISISSSVDKARITIGDLITYTVTVTHDEEVRLEMPGLGANLGGFEIRDYEVHDPEKSKGTVVSSVDYVISTFFTGEYEIPPLTVQYFMPGDSTGMALTTEPIKIVVESVKPSEAGDIQDIKPPVGIPRDLWATIRWVVLSSLLLLMAILAYIVYRRKKAGMSLLPVKEAPPRPPHEVAFERLDDLKASDLLARGEIKLYYVEISEIIRQYVEGRYYIVAMEMTTTEVLEGLAGADVSENEFEHFRDFLNRCDLVKFAKGIPAAEENIAILDEAFGIVERTKVVFEEEGDSEIEAKAEAKEKTKAGEESQDDSEIVVSAASTDGKEGA